MGAVTLDVRTYVAALRDNGYGVDDIKSELQELIDSQEKAIEEKKELVSRAQIAALRSQHSRGELGGEDGMITVFVKTLSRKTIPCVCKASDKCLAIKELVEEHEAIPTDQQRLVFIGRQLEDEDIIMFCGIENECTVHLVLRLRGGMYHESSGRNGYQDLRADELDTLIQQFERNANQYEALTRRAKKWLDTCSESQDSECNKRKASD